MLTSINVLLLLVSYLLGSIPFSIIAGKLIKGIDIREFGSGNAGATNTFRVLGKKAGIPVLVLDVLKGYLAVSLVLFTSYISASEPYINLQLAFQEIYQDYFESSLVVPSAINFGLCHSSEWNLLHRRSLLDDFIQNPS